MTVGEQIRQIVAFENEGYTVHQIAIATGLTNSSVAAAIRRYRYEGEECYRDKRKADSLMMNDNPVLRLKRALREAEGVEPPAGQKHRNVITVEMLDALARTIKPGDKVNVKLITGEQDRTTVTGVYPHIAQTSIGTTF